MRMKMMKTVFLGLIMISGIVAQAGNGETYVSEDANFKITFPAEYDTDVDRQDEMTVISLSCAYEGMILLVSAFIYDEVIPEDEYALKVAEGILITADAFNSKFVKKKCVPWYADDDAPGLKNPIKGKVKNAAGIKIKFFGNMYICMAHGIEYRVTALATTKKGLNPRVENKFVSSFRLL